MKNFNQKLAAVYLDACSREPTIAREDVVSRMEELGLSVARSGSSGLKRAYVRTTRLLSLALADESLESEIALPEVLGPITPGGEPGISVVTCAMNRTENLLKALPGWLRHPEFAEIVIVDWSSEAPVRGALASAAIDDPRIRVVRVEGAPRWILSYAFNTGFRVARHETILKLDADVVLGEDFLSMNGVPGPDSFFAGNWRLAEEDQAYVNGVFFAPRAALARAGGFNEFITTYGWDDDDLYGRLEALGYRRQDVVPSTVHHLPHSDALRTASLPEREVSARDWLVATPRFQIHRNRVLVDMMPKWDKAQEPLPLTVRVRRGADMDVAIAGPPGRPVPEDTFEHATREMLREMMAWDYGPEVRKLPQDALNRVMEYPASQLSQELFDQACADPAAFPAPAAIGARKDKFFIDAQHGLGNRLRAIGSAAAIARATDRDLVIVWQPDDHCDCRFEDLFDYQGEVIDKSFLGEADALGCDVYNYMAVESGAQKGAPIVLNEGRGVYARSAFVLNSEHSQWTSENAFIKSLTPIPMIRDLVDSVRNPNDVTVHVRMEGGRKFEHLPYESAGNWTQEDHDLIAEWRAKSHFDHFMKRLDQLTVEGRAARIFVAADRPETYDAFTARFGPRVAFLPRTAYDRSAEQLRYAMADAILLSRAPLMLGSTWSSFSELAMRLAPGGIKVEMSGKDF